MTGTYLFTEMMMKRLLWALFLLVPAAWADYPRIVSQSPYITHTLQWMGLEACIVGVSRYDTLDRPHTGGVMDPDGAAIAALRPDLILTSDWTKPESLSKVTPAGTQAIRLNGFDNLGQIADNLRRIGQAAGLQDAGTRAEAFEAAMKERMAAIRGDGQRTLLLSACGGLPYTFGPGTWLADLFGQLGFAVVASQPDTHMLSGAAPAEAIHVEIEQTGATRVIVFDHSTRSQCPPILPEQPVEIVLLDDPRFLQPAPVLLQALEELALKQPHWIRQFEESRHD